MDRQTACVNSDNGLLSIQMEINKTKCDKMNFFFMISIGDKKNISFTDFMTKSIIFYLVFAQQNGDRNRFIFMLLT